MSVTYIPASVRREVRERAGNRCEYCGIHEDDTQFGCEVDHILSEKHGGETTLGNLALACFYCNRNKGSDIASVRSADDATLVRFFSPRADRWDDHFERADTGEIFPRTEIGRVTARIFGFNHEHRILERLALQ